MKTLANCKPSEFLKQTNRIRKSVETWLDITDVMKILRQKPKYETVPEGATAEERKAVIEANAELEKRQTQENFSQVLDAILEKNPDETLKLLALCCFIEPEDVDNYAVRDYLQAVVELLSDEVVLNFFTSLIRLGQMNISTALSA